MVVGTEHFTMKVLGDGFNLKREIIMIPKVTTDPEKCARTFGEPYCFDSRHLNTVLFTNYLILTIPFFSNTINFLETKKINSVM